MNWRLIFTGAIITVLLVLTWLHYYGPHIAYICYKFPGTDYTMYDCRILVRNK